MHSAEHHGHPRPADQRHGTDRRPGRRATVRPGAVRAARPASRTVRNATVVAAVLAVAAGGTYGATVQSDHGERRRPGPAAAVNGRVASGRFLNPSTDRLPTVVLGHQAAARLGIPRIAPGQEAPQVVIGQRWFTVIDILDPIPLAEDLDRSVLVGSQAAKQELAFDGHPTVLYVRADEDAMEAVADVLPATVCPELPGLVQVSRPSDALAAKRAANSTFSALFLGLSGVALLVGGIGVANTMYISVLERRSEIGLRRALGANRRQIRGQFMTESVVLSFLGGVAGTAIGALATVAYTSYQGWPPVIPLSAVVTGTGGATAIGALAGVYVCVRAARLSPTEALSSA
ncbi:FtsX-like permease family protein [Streptomyces sp. SID2888]|nr:FtsX-like permease family protein [Streptomyces sp. SID2888]